MEDIQNVLEHFRDRLNEFLEKSLHITDGAVVLSNLREVDGTVPIGVEDKVVLTLAGIEQSAVSAGGVRPTQVVLTNLYLLVLAHFTGEKYATGLGVISKVIGFLQSNPIFNQSNLPGLDSAIDSVAFEFVTLDAAQWSLYLQMAGSTYLPAAMYRVRLTPRR